MRFRLPVSGLEVDVRPPSGTEDVMLAEARAADWPLTLRLVESIASPVGRAAVDWGDLTVTDADALLLLLRRGLLSDDVVAEIDCPNDHCAERIDVTFSVTDYVAHHEPARPSGTVPAADPGWFTFEDEEHEVSFRLPSCRDLVEISTAVDPERELVRRCVRPEGVPGRTLRRIERAMEALAPMLAHELDARCPRCGEEIDAFFDPQRLTVSELRQRALSIYADVQRIASSYHWSEAEILALPGDRRRRYADLVGSAS